jgi:hypothetical protein
MNSIEKIEYIVDKILRLDEEPRKQSIVMTGLPKQEIVETFTLHKLSPPDVSIIHI